MDKRPQDLRDELKQKLADLNHETPRLADLASNFFELAGGTRAVAKMLLDEYHRQDCTAYTRSRIVQMILDATRFAEQSGSLDYNDLGGLTDEDLSTVLDNKFNSVLELLNGDVRGRQPGASESADQSAFADGAERPPEPGDPPPTV